MVELLAPIGDVRTGCLCCPPKSQRLRMDSQPHPGFGGLYLKRDGETVDLRRTYDEECESYAQDFEDVAAGDPEHDWRLEVHGPLGGVVYQRHGEAEWYAVQKLEGFA